MEITLLRPVKTGGQWKNPGDKVDLEKGEADRLIRLRVAVVYSAPPKDEPIIAPPVEGKDSDENNDGDDGYELTVEEEIQLISSIDGVSDEVAASLVKAGFNTIQRVAEANPDDLISIKYIGPTSVETIQDSAEEILGQDDSNSEED